jgi:hypothetical protein
MISRTQDKETKITLVVDPRCVISLLIKEERKAGRWTGDILKGTAGIDTIR